MRLTISDAFTSERLRDIYISTFSTTKVSGVDNILPKHFLKHQSREIDIIVVKVFFQDYKFTRYKEKLISKGAKKLPRQIAIPTLRDRIVLKALNIYLQTNLSEKLALQVPQQITRDVKSALYSMQYETVIKIDIQDFYPTINHNLLEQFLKTEGVEEEAISLIRSAISTGFSKDEVSNIGVPQGLSVSNILAEIYMIYIDNILKGKEIFYRRYVDDVLIFCNKNEAQDIFEEYDRYTQELGLKIHSLDAGADKTIIRDIKQEFSYLGYVFNPQNKHESTSISVRESSKKRFIDSIAALFTSYSNSGKKRSKGLLYWKLNLRITGCIAKNKCKGWLFFFSEMDDMLMLFEIDNMIKKLCLRNNVDYKGIKKLTRTIHEIRYNRWESSYFPNFDSYNYKNMKEVISFDKGIAMHKLRLSDSDIVSRFWSIVNREIRSMETDISSFS
ncbi:reverse transcriptase/maturase family protein [Vibrio mangrovi]|uniref:Reverse transcriptase (RNA-dependent DNA polymerase) n=1 Tax=Vibrio mangrovi TaxID=474394 RepID=A0A1Y6INF4_9VIBR|nr:reverse transcriptase/maturase family protein [Vibrio mangrovi]MDW6004004.1 reverse transcriptase/maturase family protein [Vibrio mangrovi]SMR99199.1 Reverse transcriptase (RNA-dependent DNA polymerase) [Vibrio mangrovi]